jgi:DNA-binding MarR family transcriptional regulator
VKISESKYRHCLYFTSNALARKAGKLAQQSWKKVDLPPSHAYLLMLVLEDPGIQPGHLAEQLQLQPSTITRLADKLEQKKLLVRTTVGKVTNVYPTPRAKELFPKMKECLAEFYENCAAIAGETESTRLVTQMGRFADKLAD